MASRNVILGYFTPMVVDNPAMGLQWVAQCALMKEVRPKFIIRLKYNHFKSAATQSWVDIVHYALLGSGGQANANP
jgi:hypothetical protein